MAPLLLFLIVQQGQSLQRKGSFQESALTAQINFCYQPKSSLGVLCTKKTPRRCAKNAEFIYTNFAKKNSTRWSISRLTSDIPWYVQCCRELFFLCFSVFAFILSYAVCLLYFITTVCCSLDGVNFVWTIHLCCKTK